MNEIEKLYEKTEMYKALKEVNDQMVARDMDKITIQVVGGFAMIGEGLRDAENTDIDYIGNQLFSDNFRSVVDDIGIRHGLGRGWINNDVMLSGFSVDDFELSTGKLHFHPLFELEKIKVEILDAKDLLKMKLIAIDTSLTAVEAEGDFTRAKDLRDIAKLLERQGLTVKEAIKKHKEYIINGYTEPVLRAYIEGGHDLAAVMDAVKSIREKAEYQRLKEKFEPKRTTEKSPMLQNMLEQAKRRAHEEDAR